MSEFDHIYKEGLWGKDREGNGTSGVGSSPQHLLLYMAFLQGMMQTHRIRSVIDLGCGDWQFSRFINWSGIYYRGYDVVASVIEKNRRLYSRKNIEFHLSDGAFTDLPRADLFLCKDVLQHLPNIEISAILSQLYKYPISLLTNDIDLNIQENADILRGGFRRLDLSKPPFSLQGTKVLTYSVKENMKQVLAVRGI